MAVIRDRETMLSVKISLKSVALPLSFKFMSPCKKGKNIRIFAGISLHFHLRINILKELKMILKPFIFNEGGAIAKY